MELIRVFPDFQTINNGVPNGYLEAKKFIELEDIEKFLFEFEKNKPKHFLKQKLNVSQRVFDLISNNKKILMIINRLNIKVKINNNIPKGFMFIN